MTTTEAKPAASPEELLKAAVAGKATAPAITAAEPASNAPWRKLVVLRKAEPRLLAVAGGALALGALLGAGATSLATSHDRGSSAAIAALASAIDTGRSDSAKLAKTIAKLEQSVAEIRTATDATRRDAASKGGGVGDRIAQLDRNLTTKLASLGERIEQAERDQAGRLAALTSRPAPAAKAEPTQTGSLAEPRDKAPEAKVAETRQAEVKQPEAAKAEAPAKPQVLENFALRDVYEGAAIIENRNRRLFQVMPGDTLPGAGRVEALERRGRAWVLVTRQGLVTSQPW